MELESISLRAVRESDLSVLGALRNDPRLQRALMWRPVPQDEGAVRAWIRRRTDDVRGAFFVIGAEDDKPVGFVQLVDIDRAAGHARLGICLVDTSRSRGAGRAALEQVEEYAREVLGLRKIVLEVLADNERALAVYAAAGYRVVGVLEAHYAFGPDLLDVVLMEHRLSPHSAPGTGATASRQVDERPQGGQSSVTR